MSRNAKANELLVPTLARIEEFAETESGSSLETSLCTIRNAAIKAYEALSSHSYKLSETVAGETLHVGIERAINSLQTAIKLGTKLKTLAMRDSTSGSTILNDRLDKTSIIIGELVSIVHILTDPPRHHEYISDDLFGDD